MVLNVIFDCMPSVSVVTPGCRIQDECRIHFICQELTFATTETYSSYILIAGFSLYFSKTDKEIYSCQSHRVYASLCLNLHLNP